MVIRNLAGHPGLPCNLLARQVLGSDALLAMDTIKTKWVNERSTGMQPQGMPSASTTRDPLINGVKVVFFTDPDGNFLHLIRRETPLRPSFLLPPRMLSRPYLGQGSAVVL